jgi:hypothetical protein
VPEPDCIDGVCAPREGCTEDEDCGLAFDCVCGCTVAADAGEIATDECLTTLEERYDGCGACTVDSDCGPCPPAPSGVSCVDGGCEGTHTREDWILAPCGGPYSDCPDGFVCYPDMSECGYGAYGVCYPDDREFCDGLGGLPCPHDGTSCLHMSIGDDVFGLCLYPDEIPRVCDELPGCFDCDVDSGPSAS